LSSEAKLAVDMLGIQRDVTVEKAVRELGRPRKPASSQRALKEDHYPERAVVLSQTETTVTADAEGTPRRHAAPLLRELIPGQRRPS
jgi:hypothetical protein